MKTWLRYLLIGVLLSLILIPTIKLHAMPSIEHELFLPIVFTNQSSAVNVITNGDFESGRTAWTEFEDSVFFEFPLIVQNNELPTGIQPHEGTWVSWLGGDSSLTSYIEQQVPIPDSDPMLVYWYWIDSIFGCDTSVAQVVIDGDVLQEYSLCDATDTGGWSNHTINLNPYSGQTVNLRFYSQTDTDNYSSFYIDAVSIHESH